MREVHSGSPVNLVPMLMSYFVSEVDMTLLYEVSDLEWTPLLSCVS